MALVVDASAAVQAALSETGFDLITGHDPVAPPLLWSESLAVLHGFAFRKEISGELARSARQKLLDAPIARVLPDELYPRTWEVAQSLGWMRTYDAEYVALASLLSCPLLTLDQRLARGAGRLVEVTDPLSLRTEESDDA